MNNISFVKLLKAWLVVITLTLASTFSSAAASADAPASLADVWKMVPNDGQTEKFEAAFQKHLKFRIKQQDPRQWQTYKPVIGSDLTFYIIRSCCFNWSDLDSYQQWSEQAKVMEHWNNHVAPFVHRYEHYFSELDFANSHWPEENHDFRYFAVTEYRAKMGKNASITEGKRSLSAYAKAMKWPFYWSWGEQVGGKGGLSLVVPYKSYADMAPPEVSFYQAIANHLKDDEKTQTLFSQWSSNFKATHYTVYEMRADLSMHKPNKQ